jgi:hypothetical protein
VQYDLTRDPRFEPYCVGASKVLKRLVTPDDEAGRELGEIYDLSFGFGGGLGVAALQCPDRRASDRTGSTAS